MLGRPTGAPYTSLRASGSGVGVQLGRKRLVLTLAAVLPLIGAAVLLLSAKTPSWLLAGPPILSTYSSIAIPPASASNCLSLALLADRNNASFWSIETFASSPPSIVIQPANATVFYNCPELALASFTLRLHFHNETHLVRAPPRQGPLGRYVFTDLPGPMFASTGVAQAEVEALLEFGHFPGLASGQPCSSTTCWDRAYPGLYSGTWSGEEIFEDRVNRRRSTITVPAVHAIPSSATLPNCVALDALPAAILHPSNSFAYGSTAGDPCQLPQIALPSRAPSRWIHLFGDSNFRHLVGAVAHRFGTGVCRWATLQKEPYPTHAVCEDVGQGYIVTFAFVFFRGPLFGNGTDYDHTDLNSLKAFVDGMPFDAKAPKPPASVMLDIPLSHVFIGTGSHSPQLSSTGMRATLEEYKDAFDRKVRQSFATTFVAVPSVDAARIPTNYGNQAAHRNNVMIRHQNAVLRDWVLSTYRHGEATFIDVFGLTMVLNNAQRRDAVHFQDFVYDEWASVVAASVAQANAGKVSA